MSSDDYFDDSEQLDSAFFAALDAIEATHSQLPPSASGITQSKPHASPPISPKPLNTISNSISAPHKPIFKPAAPPKPHPPAKPVHVDIDINADDSYDAFFDDIDPSEFERLDKDTEAAYKQGPNVSRPNIATGSGVTRQLTLFGDALPLTAPRSQRQPPQPGPSKPPRSPRNPFGQKSRKTKKWDHTAFAKSGWKSSKGAKGKEKAKAGGSDEEADEENEEFEQFPASIPEKYSFGPPPPFKHTPDLLAAQTWIYPTNQPKRDYQFNIVRESLFENSLVSLPTGLGKTFIAGVVMLNYYRWFPEGKVVFVAPTKPLVAQQIEACHKTCGIPGGDAAELTGQNPRAVRARAWMEKRVFYMTPQTFMNDLKTDNCDPTDIVLLVIDEAHKATGDYAYAQVVRYLMAKNAHFRVLALTATPGAKSEAVQAIVDSLHISNIEIRDENSIDLRQYIQPKKISIHIVRMTEDVIKVRDMLAKLMEKIAKPLQTNGLVPNLNVVTLHPYRCNALMGEFSRNGVGKKFRGVFPALKKLGSLARAMAYLLECSFAMCHQALLELSRDIDETGKKSTELSQKDQGFRSEPLYKDVVEEMERQHNAGGFSLHPKMDKLQSLAVDYFAQAKADADERARLNPDAESEAPGRETKMMVFTNFRASVDEIVEMLNVHKPMIRATHFIGQGTDKNGKKGIAQKEQLEVIKKFKEGVYNVLVATSIGEEGLDIGEVDMIICYDAQKTPIRMLQRVGRTGRKRAGRVEVLLSEAREEANWDKAKGDYESVQTTIIRGDSLELFGDVDRLLPEHIKPKCIETYMAIEEYVRDTKAVKAPATAPKGTKRKRNADVSRNIPSGAITGFISSAKLIPKGSKKRKTTSREFNPDDLKDDEVDIALEAGIHGPPLTTSEPKRKGKGKDVAKKPRTKSGTASRSKKSSCSRSGLTTSQLARDLEDGTDDKEIEMGLKLSSPVRPLSLVQSSKPQSLPSPSNSVISVHSSPDGRRTPACTSRTHLVSGSPHQPRDDSWLLDSDDDVQIIETPPYPDFAKGLKVDHTHPTTPEVSSPFKHSPLSHIPKEKTRIAGSSMLPPSVPAHSLTPSDGPPELSFAIRRPGVRRKRIRPETFSSSPAQLLRSDKNQCSSPAPSLPRPPRKRRRHQASVDPSGAKLWLDIEAEVSGDDIPGGSSDSDGVESESDRRFVEELAATQASPSYDQTAAYRNSLFTQAPGGRGGPIFASKPVRRGAFGCKRTPSRILVSSSPTKDETLPDQYSMDSFVVEDDDDILANDDTPSSGF